MTKAESQRGDQDQQKRREKRGTLLTGLMRALPAKIEPFYGSDATRYRELFEEHALEELQAMFVSRMAAVTRKWDAFLEQQIKPHGLSLRHWRALYMVAVLSPGETLTTIAARIGVPNPTLVRILHELEAEGLLERTAHDQDRRAKPLVLTAAGNRVFAKMSALNGQLRGEFLKGVSEPELLLVVEMLDLLNERLDHLT